ncbi:putative secretion ATPase, PEP-CTERM locus subfamily [Sphingomonas guangdongensis]|uniref:Putative secretion ATPase, PEP-CTERM locus subfamily n=1 Tax=Sphingomonas guangdongensis TaxID=1141890 RepID=A0A285R0F1_9SPHN|nr:AAA family ATPase [Sphingomonas guangdongensis]SOB87606.1 putative secretion ATPase, PEP-CTERM locus subfamily [Sphingomonas guangdongensis]
MYEDHYRLSGRPFQLTPDPRFWFESATHRKAMAYLGYGLAQGEGFIVITGDIGAGKTTLVGHLTDTIDRERMHIVKIVSTQIEAEELLRTVCAGLDVDATGMTKAVMLQAIERGLHAVARAGRRTLLIVDEAQALPVASLEELRMLSNFQAAGHALLQIFLLGQPEFRDLLHDTRLEQLRQRVIAMHHLGPMAANELDPYLTHRLSVVGWTGTPRFGADAVAAINDWSGGIPRRVNQLAARVLLLGAIEEVELFTADHVASVIADLDGDAAPRPVPVWPIEAAEPAAVEDITAEAEQSTISDEPPVIETAMLEQAVEEAIAEATAPVSVIDLDLARRLAAIEQRMDEQDAALRRVLTLMVDWVEGGARPDSASLRQSVA